MKQDIINIAKNNIIAKKREAEREYNERMKPLRQNPKFDELEKSYTRLLIENARKEALGEKTDKDEENKLKQKLDQCKQKFGLDHVNYSCKICNDSGMVNGQFCSCLKKEISSLLLKNSGFENLEDFKNAKFSSETTKLFYDKMKQWCESDFKKNLILISGSTGVGKTYLIKCMANELLERGKVLKISTAYAMNQDFQNFYKKKDDSFLQKYLEVEILFIDDFGAEPFYKNVTEECFYLTINERKMKRLPTIITTNLTLDDIRARYGERIYSRIVDRQTSINFFLVGDDLRTKKF